MSIVLLLIVLVPFLALIPLVALGKRYSYYVSIAASAVVFLLTIYALYVTTTGGAASLAFSQLYIPQLGLNFGLQVNQYTIMLLAMTSIVFLAASIVGKYFINSRDLLYNIIFLIAAGASLGVFISSNLVFFYVFWEISEVMMFFIIFLFGGYNRRYAGIKFLLYSIASSLLLLIAVITLYTSLHTFDIASLIQNSGSLSIPTQLFVMALFVLSFMIKVPVFPFHTWLPDAHTEAPTTGSMILAGVLLKFGGYGLLLMFEILPVATIYAPYLFIIFLLSTVYAAFVSLHQTNIKRLIAYTSITDMGIVGVGLAAANTFGYSGAVYAMLNHGIAISILFLIAGTLDELYGTLDIGKIKGVAKNFPIVFYIFLIGAFTALGIPLTSGFIADLLVFIGAFGTFGVIGLLPLFGVIIMGAALFWVIERSFVNNAHATEPYNILDDTVMIASAILIMAAIFFGILPSIFV